MTPRPARPRLAIATPATAAANNGNWRTAERWAGFLRADGDLDVSLHAAADLAGIETADALIALHAIQSRAAVARFRAGRPDAPFAVVLTGTDLYGDALDRLGQGAGAGARAGARRQSDAAADREPGHRPADPARSGRGGGAGDGDRDRAGESDGGRSGAWRHAAESASALVVLQPAALERLGPALRAKARVIVQSAIAVQAVAEDGEAEVVAVGHLRAVKDPRTLWRAACRLFGAPARAPGDPRCPRPVAKAHDIQPGTSPAALAHAFRIDHIGAALDPGLADEARAAEAACGGAFRWRGALDHAATRRAIAAARLLVHPSLAEGGANAVIEAIVSGTAVIASRIDGNTGLLGDDHGGLFPPGDDAALAGLVERFFAEPAFAAELRAQGAALAPRHAPEAERAAVRALAHELLAVSRR